MNDKQLVALQAAKLVENNMLVGLGTGSTADLFIEELARRYREEGLSITTVASSVVSSIKAKHLGLPLVSIENLNNLDLYVDGADEVTPDLTLLKGQGSDLVREKILARACEQFLVLVDLCKLVASFGARFAIPIEVMPFAWQLVKKHLEKMGGTGDLRQNASKTGLAVSSYGSLILDMTFAEDLDIKSLNELLNGTPGVVEHGVFSELASVVFSAENGKVTEMRAT
jgi:ribose 5-phosphate isomerase A